MYKLKKIEKTKQKGIYKLHFENHDALLIHEDVLLSNEVLVKREFNEAEIKELELANSFSAAYYEGIKFITRKLRSKHEMKKMLRKKEFGISVIEQTVQRLEAQGYLNDAHYARSYANTVLRTSTKGIDFIRKTLSEHSISLDIINNAIEHLDLEEEYDKLFKLVTKRISTNKKLSNQVLREKLFYEFKTKGFTSEMINQVFSEVDFSLPNDKLEKEIVKLMNKHKDKYKVKQLLMKKGFRSDQIEEVMMKEGLDGIY
jgi:regulatory protein